MHLRDPDLRRDLRLRHRTEETELDDPTLPLVERVEALGDERAVVDVSVPGLVDAELVGVRLVSPSLEGSVQ